MSSIARLSCGWLPVLKSGVVFLGYKMTNRYSGGRGKHLWDFETSLFYNETLKLGAFPFQPAHRAF